MSSEYHIEKVRRQVSVRLAGGLSLEGEIFLQPTARYRSGPQEPAELLAESDPFFPLAAPEGFLLLAKDQLIVMQFSAGAADTDLEGVASAVVDVECTGGVTLHGHLRLETRIERPRLLDFLNTAELSFLTLHDGDRVSIVNRRHILLVRHRP